VDNNILISNSGLWEKDNMNKAVHILIVEDDIIIAENIKSKLNSLGYSAPTIATTSEEAIRATEETHPHLVLMDIKLQGEMDGIETATNIRSKFDIPVIYLTAYTDKETVERAKLTEPFGYIVKPFATGELHSTIVMALHKHKLEKELKKSEERYRTAVECSNDGVTIIQDDCYAYVNGKFVDMFGYNNKEEVIGKPLSMTTHPDSLKAVLNYSRKKRRGTAPLRYELKGIKKNSEIIYIEASITTIDFQGKLASLAYMRDITTRKKTELEHEALMQNIRQAKLEWEATVDTLPEIVCLLDDQGTIVRSNHAVKEWKIGDVQSILGRGLHNMLHPDCLQKSCKLKVQFSRVLERLRRENQIEFDIDDPILDRHLSMRFRKILKGKTERNPYQKNYFVAIIQDITERKRTETELRLAYEELQEAQQELIQAERLAVLGKFSSGIAHELRNPLANMSASAQFCLSKYHMGKPIRKNLEVILRNSESANKIVRELLELARPSEASSKLGQIGEAIDKACALVRTKCEKQHILLHKRWSKKLPLIFCDEERLEKAFLNIILNAIDAMPNGGRLAVTAYSDSRNNDVVVSFLDTGSGIPHKDLDKIFHPFFTDKKDGIGLGLCLTQQVISYHKGDIKVKSDVGKGTEIIVRLPVSRKHRIRWRKENGKNISC